MSDALPAQASESKPARRRVRVPGAAEPVATMPEPAAVSSGLPNAIDVDARKITAPVLTRQGWVMPDESAKRQGAKG